MLTEMSLFNLINHRDNTIESINRNASFTTYVFLLYIYDIINTASEGILCTQSNTITIANTSTLVPNTASF